MQPFRVQMFEGITQDAFNGLVAKLKDKTGVELEGNSGTESSHGFTVEYNYNPTSLTLSLQVIQAPFPARFAQDKVLATIAAMVNGN